MKNYPSKRLEYIEWRDASSSLEWGAYDELPADDDVIISAGFVLAENDIWVRISTSLNEGPDHAADPLNIPKATIVKRYKLSLKEAI